VENSTYTPTWVSTDEQLDGLVAAYKSSSLIRKVIGRREIPGNIAYLRSVLMPWMRMPVVFIAQGVLQLQQESLLFRPSSFKAFGWRVNSPFQQLSFDIDRRDVMSIEPVEFKSPVMRMYDFRFSRIRTSKPGLLGNFLLCAGGKFSMARARSKTEEMAADLASWLAK